MSPIQTVASKMSLGLNNIIVLLFLGKEGALMFWAVKGGDLRTGALEPLPDVSRWGKMNYRRS